MLMPPPIANVATGYATFVITAEESGDLNTGQFEWAFGNGNDTPSGTGVIVPADCELIALTLSHENNATTTVELWQNTVGSNQRVSTRNSRKGITRLDTPHTIFADDVINFKTITGSTASNGSVVAAWFKQRITQ